MKPRHIGAITAAALAAASLVTSVAAHSTPSAKNAPALSPAITPDFADAQVTPASYRYMLDQTRQALYGEFPEARGHIEILDQTADLNGEVDRISHALHFTSQADREDFVEKFWADLNGKESEGHGKSGHAFWYADPKGRHYSVALGWGAERGHNLGIQKAFIHECTHGLDYVMHPYAYAWDQTAYSALDQDQPGIEGLAEATATMVMAENGGGKTLISDLSAGYSARQDEPGGWEDYDIYGATPYLLSQTAYHQQHAHYDGSIKGWRAVFMQISNLRAKHLSFMQQKAFEVIDASLEHMRAEAVSPQDKDAYQAWVKTVQDVPEYENMVAAKAYRQGTKVQFVPPSFTTEGYTRAVTVLWKSYAANPDDRRTAELLVDYRDVNSAIPQQPLSKIEKGLLKSGQITLNMVSSLTAFQVDLRKANLWKRNPPAPTANAAQPGQTTKAPFRLAPIR